MLKIVFRENAKIHADSCDRRAEKEARKRIVKTLKLHETDKTKVTKKLPQHASLLSESNGALELEQVHALPPPRPVLDGSKF